MKSNVDSYKYKLRRHLGKTRGAIEKRAKTELHVSDGTKACQKIGGIRRRGTAKQKPAQTSKAKPLSLHKLRDWISAKLADRYGVIVSMEETYCSKWEGRGNLYGGNTKNGGSAARRPDAPARFGQGHQNC